MTARQRAFARQQRAVNTLRKAAVRYSVAGDNANGLSSATELGLAFADLTIACDRYTNTLTARERSKLCRKK
jgi:hypothetical protein